jgi:hypothetical protein
MEALLSLCCFSFIMFVLGIICGWTLSEKRPKESDSKRTEDHVGHD